MKGIIIGTALILFGLFATPCYIEPTDLVVSTFYITSSAAWFGPENAALILPIWMAIGYIAIFLGVMLIGKSALKKFGLSKCIIFMHPAFYITLICFFSILITAFVYYKFHM